MQIRRRPLRPWVAPLLAAALFACGQPAPPGEPSVVLLVLDAAGARYFGAYGNELPATPRLDAFAEDAAVFERAYAQAAWTLPSVGSLMTGRYPPMRSEDLRVVETETLAHVLQRAGFGTAAFSENPYVTRDFGFATGFDEFREYFPYAVLRHGALAYERLDSARTVDEALAWVRARGDERFFLYVHLLAPHAPYDPPPPFRGRFDPDYAGRVHGSPDVLAAIDDGQLAIGPRDLAHLRFEYQENLAYADHQAGRLLDGLEELGALDRSLVIVAADHGEAFGEHGELEHNTTVYEEMIHVPLLVRAPGAELPERFGGVVELRSIFPTVCEALGVAGCPAQLAPSLFEHVRSAAERPGVARTWARGRKGSFTALILPRHKLIARAHSFEPLALYDLEADPGETKDVRAAEPERLREARIWLLDPNLDFFVAGEAAVDRATRERLEVLGYTE
jgi:arylsulfatase A-like enzyme